MSAAAGAIAAAVAGGVEGILGSILNYQGVKATNKANKEINTEQLDFTRSMTQAQWERDDTMHQREVADLKAAGLSPLAALGGEMNTPAQSAPSMIAQQAPQFDMNALVQSTLAASQLAETTRHNKATEEYNSGKLENETRELELRAQSLEIENKKVEETIKQNARLIKLQNDELDEKIRATKKGEELRLSELEQRQLEEESTRLYKEIARQAGGDNVNHVVINDYDIYANRLKLWTIKFNKFIETIGATQSASGKSNAGNGSVGVNVAKAGGNVSAGGSHSEYSSENISKKQEEMLRAFYANNPIPVYISKSDYPMYYKKH